jgi:electron transfer flavoprotein beta subunit
MTGAPTPPSPPSVDPTTPAIVVARKWVDRRPKVDPLTGATATDPRTSGASDPDDAALEWALRMGAAWGLEVIAVTGGPPEADAVLRTALAAGAHRGIRVSVASDAVSASVATALAQVAVGVQAAAVVCGDASWDRGSGSVPAFLAHLLGVPQALGLLRIELEDNHRGAVRAWRRLDGGRREELRVTAPFVCSVEGGTARLRRASLPDMLGGRTATVERWEETVEATVAGPAPESPVPALPPRRRRPYRPRAHVVPGPPADLGDRERIVALTGAMTQRTAPRAVEADPDRAAAMILDALAAWETEG